MERNGIRDSGFEVEEALTRLEAIMGTESVATATDHPLGHPLHDHVERRHGHTTPLADCLECGLLLAHWRMTEFLRVREHAEPWITLAEEAKKAAKHVRAARRALDAAWKVFEPTATEAHDRWQRWPGVFTNHDDALVSETAPAALNALEDTNTKLEALSGLHMRGHDLQLAQPLGSKPRAQLLWEVEAALHDAGITDEGIAEVTQGKADDGEKRRIRNRRLECQKDR